MPLEIRPIQTKKGAMQQNHNELQLNNKLIL